MFHRQALFTLPLLLVIFISACNFTAISTPTATSSPTREIRILQTMSAVSPTATPVILTPTPRPGISFYTVLKGETLSGIAAKLGIDMAGLAKANYLTDPYWVYDGQQLLVATEPITVAEPTFKSGKQIVVILSQQKVYTFENWVLIKDFLVSTGVTAFPTVVGEYAIYIKLDSTRMTGPGYDLSNVPWTMYFYQGYGFHGTYWHNNFGTPMSHGCVNMRTEDADWLYHWAEVGTPVLILP